MSSISISGLSKSKSYKDDRIHISFRTGNVSSSLSVHLFDSDKKPHHVFWLISPDRCSQSFDKVNDKVRNFIFEKVERWKKEEEEERRRKLTEIQLANEEYEGFIKSLVDQF